MAEWDGLLSNSGAYPTRVMVMAATNRPFALDDAVLRRLPRRILVDLPDSAARLKILQLMLKNDLLADDLDLAHIAGPLTQSYSGSDLKNLCIAAAMNSLRERLKLADLDSLTLTPIRLAHFESALQEVPASISDSMDTITQLRKWDQEFGEGKRLGKKATGLGFVMP
jgi:SpoVK/Ycf46/Vps4 family AAA+-type ATPase